VEWRYVPTSLNPSDILSRGAFPAELNESPLGAHGPKFLCGPNADWPTPIIAEKPPLDVCRRILLIKLLFRLVQRSQLWDDTKSLQSKGIGALIQLARISFVIH